MLMINTLLVLSSDAYGGDTANANPDGSISATPFLLLRDGF